MDPITHKLVPGAAGFIPNQYANDVFSVDTWLGTGTGASTAANKKITNGINMAEHGGMKLESLLLMLVTTISLLVLLTMHLLIQ